MTNQTDLEQRVAAVERTLADLQKQVSASQLPNWIEAITGTFKDEPAFDEVLAYGREFRQAEIEFAPKTKFKLTDLNL